MGKKWRIAVIGAGEMGRQHADGWTRNGYEVVSVTDVDERRARSLAEGFGIPRVFGDYREAIEDLDVDIVSVCLPLPFHAEVAVAAARRGKHIFSEKPLASDLREAAEIEEATRAAGVQFGLGFQRNLSKGVQAVQELVQSGRLGRPVVFHVDTVQEIRPKRIMHDAEGNQGPVMDLGCHHYTLWATVFQSQPKTVRAIGRVLAKDRPELSHIGKLAVDTAIITVEYESGDVGLFTVTWGMPPRFRMNPVLDRLYGPKGGATGAFNQNTGKITLFEEDQEQDIELEVYPSLHAEQFRLFTDALDQGKPAPVGIEAGREALLLTLAIFRAIETGQTIDYSAFKEEALREAEGVQG